MKRILLNILGVPCLYVGWFFIWLAGKIKGVKFTAPKMIEKYREELK